MRKNILTLCLVMSAFVASQSAFASRARNAVLGTADPLNLFSNGSHGSLYVDDAYNMFYSPAKIADHKNFVVMEKSNGESNKITAQNDAEGGFVTSVSDFQVGVFFNRTTDIRGFYSLANNVTNPLLASAATTSQIGNMRPIELMFGGDAGVKYGLGLSYATNTNFNANTNLGDVTVQAKRIALRAGIEFQNLEVFGDIDLMGRNRYSNSTAAFGNDRDVKNNNMGLGARYKYGEWVAYAGYRAVKSTAATELVSSTSTFAKENKTNTFGLGVGRNAKLSDSTTLNYSVGYFRSKNETVAGTGAANLATRTRREIMPLNLGLESELVSWFIARGGMQFNLMNNTVGPAASVNGTAVSQTSGSLGGTFRFGKVDVDFAMSTRGNVGATSAGDMDLNGSSVGFSDSLLSYASVTYRW